MQFLKKNYEKVLLSIVLLALAAAAAALPLQVSRERDQLEEIRRNLTVKVKPKLFKPLDDWLSTNKSVLARLEHPLNVKLSGPHNLFNPVPWKRLPGNPQIVPIRTGSELGPGAVKIAKIQELSLTVAFESVIPGTNPGDASKYLVSIRRETDHSPRPITRTTSLATPRNNLFELLSVQGPTNDPIALVLKLKEDYEPITITKDKPFTRVVGYAADLEYPPGDKQTFNDKRTNDQIRLEDDPETYKIVAITRSEVVLSADSNKRRTVIKYNASSATPPQK